MSKKYLGPGDSLEFTAPAGGVTVDVPVEIGQTLVIPNVTKAATLAFTGWVRGLGTGFTKIGSQAWAEGAIIYWDDGNSRFTTVSTSNLRAGIAVDAVGAGAGETTTGRVYLDGGMRPDG